jgi:hypothetical protein
MATAVHEVHSMVQSHLPGTNVYIADSPHGVASIGAAAGSRGDFDWYSQAEGRLCRRTTMQSTGRNQLVRPHGRPKSGRKRPGACPSAWLVSILSQDGNRLTYRAIQIPTFVPCRKRSRSLTERRAGDASAIANAIVCLDLARAGNERRLRPPTMACEKYSRASVHVNRKKPESIRAAQN